MKTYLQGKVHPYLMKKRSSDLFWFKLGTLSLSIVVSASLMFLLMHKNTSRIAKFVSLKATTVKEGPGKQAVELGNDTPAFVFNESEVLFGTLGEFNIPQPRGTLAIYPKDNFVNLFQKDLRTNSKLMKALETDVFALSLPQSTHFLEFEEVLNDLKTLKRKASRGALKVVMMDVPASHSGAH